MGYNLVFVLITDLIVHRFSLKCEPFINYSPRNQLSGTARARSYFESVCVCVCGRGEGGGGLKTLFLSNSL